MTNQLPFLCIRVKRKTNYRWIERNDADGKNGLYIRKGVGEEDISGDYENYDTMKDILVDGIKVTVKGNGNTISLITWSNDGYGYAIGSTIALITEDGVKELVRQVK